MNKLIAAFLISILTHGIALVGHNYLESEMELSVRSGQQSHAIQVSIASRNAPVVEPLKTLEKPSINDLTKAVSDSTAIKADVASKMAERIVTKTQSFDADIEPIIGKEAKDTDAHIATHTEALDLTKTPLESDPVGVGNESFKKIETADTQTQSLKISDDQNQKEKTSAIKESGALSLAVVKSNGSPRYPRRAIIRNQEGKVEAEIRVDKSGAASLVKLIASSGYNMLDNSVLAFIEDEKFVPALRNGMPIESSQIFRFHFVLN